MTVGRMTRRLGGLGPPSPVRHPPERSLRAVACGALVVVLLALVGCAPAAGAPAEVAGDIGVHDPALVAGEPGSPWFVYSTGDVLLDGGELQIRRSDDGGRTWHRVGTVWDRGERPGWIAKAVPGVTNLWAPELVQHDDTWFLYYSASTFGSNRSVIGLATSPTLDPDDPDFAWSDRGPVLESDAGDDVNAIDPAVVVDEDGSPWLAFGSFWSGIRMLPLEWPDGRLAEGVTIDDAVLLAGGRPAPNAIEAPSIVHHGDAYWLLVSLGACCRGADSTYQIAVGRSDAVTGPYLDAAGVPLAEGGATVLLSSEGDRIGPGGESVSRGMVGFHFYDGTDAGLPALAIRDIAWTPDGWPSLRW